jgi:hypothetical protein
MSNTALLTAVRAYAESTAAFDAKVLDTHIEEILDQAVLQFNLAPDLFVDVGRLPASVQNLPALITYLKEIQAKLSKKDNKTKTDEWEVAKSGELRLYKLYVCCLHALREWGKTSPSWPKTTNAAGVATLVCTHARTTVPSTLGGKAKILWEKTFASEAGRTVKVMISILYLCTQTPAPTTTNTNTNTAQSGNNTSAASSGGGGGGN